MSALVDEARQQPWHYEWLPLSGVLALVALVATAVLRTSGNFSAAFGHLQPALELLDIDLSSGGIPIGDILGITPADAPFATLSLALSSRLRQHWIFVLAHAGHLGHKFCNPFSGPQFPFEAKEGDIPLQRFRNYSCLLKLKALLLEAGCYMYLTSSHYKRARASMISLLDLHARFPETMQCLRASTHMLAGQYAHCMGLYQEALRHFAAVSRCAESARDRAGVLVFAAAHTAMTELEAGGEAAIFRACEALKEAGVYNDVPSTLPENVRAAALCVSGLVLIAQGNTAGGKLRVSRVLKMGHGSLCNQHLIVQVLNILAPIQAKAGDVEGFTSMLHSSFVFAGHSQDFASQMRWFPCLEGGLRFPLMNLGWLVQLAVMGVQVAVLTLRSRFTVEANEQLQAEHEGSLRRREGHLLSAINKAKENPEEHAAILAWDA